RGSSAEPGRRAGRSYRPAVLVLFFLRVGDLDLPAGEFEPVVHEAGAVHRLDRRADRLAATIKPLAVAPAATPSQATTSIALASPSEACARSYVAASDASRTPSS